MEMVKRQTRFEEVKDDVDPAVLNHLNLPHYAQVDLNLVNMANFFPLIAPLLDAMQPRAICEIGSDEGTTTELLIDYCTARNIKLHVVDPATENENSSTVSYHKKTSLDYLQSDAPAAEVLFIDGDHNYYTVLRELESVDRSRRGEPRLIFLHDVSWPCGSIDMYYDESNIPAAALKPATVKSARVKMFATERDNPHVGLPMDKVTVSTDYGGEKNGVRPAIDRFLEGTPGWKYFDIPSLYGLGILWTATNIPEAAAVAIELLEDQLTRVRPFLAILEFNRIRLLEKLQESGELWAEQAKYISELRRDVEQLRAAALVQGELWREQNEYILQLENETKTQADLWGRQQACIQELESTTRTQADLWKHQQTYIQELESAIQERDSQSAHHREVIATMSQELQEMQNRLIEKELTIQNLQTLKGWLKSWYLRLKQS